MSRWFKKDEYGESSPGERYVHSIKHKRVKERKPRGCENNNMGAHFWVCNKYIAHYTEYRDTFEHFSTFCLLCGRGRVGRRAWRKPPASVECLVTIVEFRGKWIIGSGNGYGHWSSFKTYKYDGETDVYGSLTDVR